ncbi:low molecular weight protein-tyrosine-phosphatase [Neptunicella marina]|uniref:protein-tyrosine-phosphatase n=1 Tax=Neptunicella marina TaxID=2125989 RepID=A0A8J6M064_9ALTE|nr:low molecular weight protein-tyrosine-phosphatase [Neptunicella marina]MBC3764303.1 low molecular weight phosphotyrosine protein phosphatase [Neptunicella marina]
MHSSSSVLFVCLGNICRSPSAEAVFRKKAADAGLKIKIDSAGTQGFHKSAKPDERAMAAGEHRGYRFDNIYARKVKSDDFEKFDLILAMDESNLHDLLAQCPAEYQNKVKLFLSFAECDELEVPDPYYGGSKGFEYVLDLIEMASDGLLVSLNQTEAMN